MIPIYIGWDKKEPVAYHVLADSIIRNSSEPVSISPLNRDNLGRHFHRPRGEFDSTDFSNSRFIVPHLQQYGGWAIFMDCDMLCLADIAELWNQRDDKYAVMVKKHNHVPQEDLKFLDQEQTKYDRKNWSSLMLLNCNRLRVLTKHVVNTAPGLWMHQLRFLDDAEIGEIKGDWNLLVGYDGYEPDAKLVHFTSGGPWHGYVKADYSTQWKNQLYDVIQGDNPVDFLEVDNEYNALRFGEDAAPQDVQEGIQKAKKA